MNLYNSLIRIALLFVLLLPLQGMAEPTVKVQAVPVISNNSNISSNSSHSNTSKIAAKKPSSEKVQITLEKKHLNHLLLLIGCLVVLLLFGFSMCFIVLRKKPHEYLKDNLLDENFSKAFADEINLKLDLAKQYMELGDAQNAKILLDDVILQGSSHEKEEAEALLIELSNR